MARKGHLSDISQFCTPKRSLITVAFVARIVKPQILQPALATSNLLSSSSSYKTINDDQDDESNNPSTTLVQSNQSSTLLGKNNVTLRGLFTDLGDPGRWTQLFQPALNELNRCHPDMNIQIEYTDFLYNETRNQILDKLSNGNSEDIVSLD